MRNRITALLLGTALILIACGGGHTRAEGIRGEVADDAIADLESEGIDVDKGCVHDAAGELSEADATAMLENGDTNDISDEGLEIAFRMFLECADLGE